MTKCITVTCCLLLTLCFSQTLSAQEILLEKKYTDSYLKKGLPLEDGYAIVGNNFYDKVSGGKNYREYEPFLARFDANMELVWQKNFARHSHTDLEDVLQVEDGFFVLGAEHGKTKLIKLDLNGQQLWERSYPYPAYNATEGTWLKALPDGDLLMMGRAFRRDNSFGQPWLQRLNPEGKPIWERIFRDDALCGLNNPLLTDHNSVVMTGSAWPESRDLQEEVSEGWMVELDLDDPQNELKNKRFTKWRSQSLSQAIALDNGHYWVAGWYNEHAKPNVRRTGVLMELDADLNLLHSKTFGEDRHGYFFQMLWNPEDQRIYLFGLSFLNSDKTKAHRHLVSLNPDWTGVKQEFGEPDQRYRSVAFFETGELLAVGMREAQVID